MTLEVGAMMAEGIAALVAGPILAWPRLRAASGAERLIILGPVFEASALATFSAEHFTAARDLAPLVPHWLPWPLFWVYFFGVCLAATAISFVIGRSVRTSAALLVLFFLLVVITIDLPNVHRLFHSRFFWILTFRETAFASGALVLSGSLWPRGHVAHQALTRIGRTVLGAILVFYAIEHFFYPHFVTGVPLQKPTPAWIPAPVLWAYIVGIALLLGGIGLLFGRTVRMASAGTGLVLLLLTAFFYVPIMVKEFHSPALEVEGLNFVFDTLLFAATVLLAGFAAESVADAPAPTAGLDQTAAASLP
jgi:uncharacterized membrane protein